MTALDRFLPPGFRAVAALGYALAGIGAAQLASLFARDEPYPVSAALLALLLAGGGAAVVAFVRRNATTPAEPLAERSPSDLLATAALAVVALETFALLWTTGSFFPLRLAFFGAADPSESPLPMMVAGTCLVALGALSTAALCGALWLLLYARGVDARPARALLSFAGAAPYVAVALIVRALVCGDVALLATGRFLLLRPDEDLAYRSLLAMAPGFLAASVALGLQLGRGLWSFLDQARAAEESSDSFVAATLRGQKPWEIVLRQGLWLRRRRDLGALLLSGMASAALIDVLSNTLIDSFRPPGFPTYPSLGAALFLRGLADNGVPAPLPPAWQLAHVAIVLAALLLLLAQTLPRRSGRASLHEGTLRLDGKLLARGVASAHGLAPRPALQWILGASGSGKSTLLRSWAAQLRDAVLVPQDPDDALPGTLAATDLVKLAKRAAPRGDRVLWDLLGRVDDERLRRRLSDPFTPLSSFSRGERQRLLVCLALARLRDDPDCTLLLDEPTSAQDAARTAALLDCLRELLPAKFAGSGSLVFATHDPGPFDALLGDRSAQAVTDHVLWLEDAQAHRFSVRSQRRWEGATAQPPALLEYLGAVRALLDAGASPGSSLPIAGGDEGVRLWRAHAAIAGRRHAISQDARLRGGQLAVLWGPSGAGKSTLLREIVSRPGAYMEAGYVMQDSARAWPHEAPVGEVLGPGASEDALRRWFGAAFRPALLSRPIGALSEGERQRVLLAAEVLRLEQRPATRARPRVLLLDEPFGALDPPQHVRLMEEILQWLRASQGRNAAVLVTHSPLMDLGLARAGGVPAIEWTIGEGP